MKRPGFLMTFVILLMVQVLLGNFFTFTRFVTIFVLPVMILCIPIDKGTIFCMLASFLTGFAYDFLCDGMIGLTSMALVPVGLLREGIIRLVFGSELFARGENISIRKQGVGATILATMLATSVFLAVYIAADAAGTMPFWFNLTRFGISLLVSTIVSFFVAYLLTTDGRWK